MTWLVVWTLADAAELRAIRQGDTIESIAEELGTADLAPVIRVLNRLKIDEQPEVGRLIDLPPSVVVPQVEQRAVVVSLHGKVTVAAPGRAARPARRFSPIDVGSEICTGELSFATVQLATACDGGEAAGDVAVLLADSCVEIRSLVASPLGLSSVIRLNRGSLIVPDVGHEKSSIAVQAADGVTIGPGGFRSHVEVGDRARTEAVYQAVTVVSRAGEQQELAAGMGARIESGGAISEPVPLLRAGELRTPQVGEALRRPVFTWAPESEAFGYRVTVSTDAQGQGILYQEPVSEAIHAPAQLLLPDLPMWWHVTPLDRLGFLGIPSDPRPLGRP